MAYSRDVISNEIEKKILEGMIVNTSYLRDVVKMIRPVYFQIDYVKKVSQWVLNYYQTYKKSPGEDLELIFRTESIKLKEAEAEIVSDMLQDISDQSDQSFNKDYLLDETIQFCKQRSLSILISGVQSYILQGKIDKAEALVRDFHKVAKSTSEWINPFDKEEVQKTLEEDDANKLFKLPGVLGEMMGYFHREWLVAVMAPMKRGKSFMSFEIAYYALTNKLKVVWYSLEMNQTTIKKRIYKRLTAMAEQGGEYAYPVFDCMSNQNDSCKKVERVNKIGLLLPSGGKPKFSSEMKYRPCDYCRYYEKEYDNYFPQTWWGIQIQENDLDTDSILKKTQGFKKMYGNNLRIRAYPAFSASFDDVIADLDDLEHTQGFVPDVILIDYFDIMKKEGGGDDRSEANEKWQRGKNLAGVRKALVINANQSNRDSIEKTNISQTNTGEDIRKLAHVDVMFVLNQSDAEKKEGRMRVQTLIHRHEESTEKGQVLVLQQLRLGQPFLDSEWVDNQTFRKGGK